MFEILQVLPKCDTKTQSKQILLQKTAPIDMFNAGWPQTFNLLKNVTSSKSNKMKHACIHPCCCSVAKSYLTLLPHKLKHARLLCPSPSPRVCPSLSSLRQDISHSLGAWHCGRCWGCKGKSQSWK